MVTAVSIVLTTLSAAVVALDIYLRIQSFRREWNRLS